MIYTENQLSAINHRNGNLLIIACAGSGKTEVISRRIALLVCEGVERSSIIAFTFTEKAAGALKARIRKYLEELRPDDPSLGDMYVGTIHSFCLQLLKELNFNYRNYDIIDEVRQVALISSKFNELGLDRLRVRDGYFATIRAFINTLNVLYTENLSDERIGNEAVRFAVRRYREITRTRPNYFLDFDAIVDELLKLLYSRPDLLEQVQNRFCHVVVDEYQDVDPRQEELIVLLTGGGSQLCVVGDDDQSLYKWRGADIHNILSFKERYPNVTKIELTDNFRSTHAVVEIANSAVRKLPPESRLGKNMMARHWEGPNGEGLLVETMAFHGDVQRAFFASEEEEARYVADRILHLRGVEIDDGGLVRGMDWGDMAVLLRSVRANARHFVEEFRRRGIPYVVRGTSGLFDHIEVKLVQATFCQLAEMEFSHIENGRRVTLDDRETREFIRNIIIELRDSEIMPGADTAAFMEWIAEKRRYLQLANMRREIRPRGVSRRIFPQDIFHEVLHSLGANAGLQPWPDVVLYNLGRFSYLLTQFEAVHQWVTPHDLFKLNIFLNGWAANHTDEGGQDDPTVMNAVQIFTIHGAKGLEWPVVFIPRINSRHFPSSRRNHGVETMLDSLEYNRQRYVGGDDGERRLWYVALTRCRKFLHITALSKRGTLPTQFFSEIRHDYVQDDGTDSSEPRVRRQPSHPVDAELLPTSYSDLNYYWQCPFDYRLRKLMGFGPKVGQEFGYGQQIHNLLSAIHQKAAQGPVDEEWVRNLVDQRFNLRYTRDSTEQQPFTTMKEAAKATLVRYVNEHPNLHELVFQPEKSFEFVLEEALINGTIDLLERREQDTGERIPVAVVDFKTASGGEDAPLEERLEEVARQLRLYAVAARDALGFNPREAHAHFMFSGRRHERVSVDIGEDARMVINREVADAVRSIKVAEFPLRPCRESRCTNNCDFNRICPGCGNL